MAIDINAKVAEAFIALITAANVGTENIYDIMASAEKEAPCVGCGVQGPVSEDTDTPGNFWVDALVVVKWTAAVDTDGVDPKTDALALDAAVLTALERDDLGTALEAGVSDFTVFGFGDTKEIERAVDGDTWSLTWRRRMFCCCSTLRP